MSEPIAGKFLLEILTKGMYSNPMHVYREYIVSAHIFRKKRTFSVNARCLHKIIQKKAG